MAYISGFTFFLNQIEFNFRTPFEFIPHYFIRRANVSESGIIRKSFSNNLGDKFEDYYKYEITKNEDNKFTLKLNDPSKWRYWIIEYKEGNNSEIHNIQLAFLLSETNLKLDATFFFEDGQGRGCIAPSGVAINYYDNPFKNLEIIKVDKENILKVRSIYKLIKKFEDNDWDNKRLRSFKEIESIKWTSPLRLLAYFIIWELLLAHKPDSKDPGDSITRQLKNKINLVNNRMSEKINFSGLIAEEIKLDTIIKKLYSLRSQIVHGDNPDYRRSLSILRGIENAESILREITRKLLIHSLKEPELFRDLKNC